MLRNDLMQDRLHGTQMYFRNVGLYTQMATLAQINERLGSLQRDFASAMNDRENLFATIDSLEDKINALSGKQLTAEETAQLTSLDNELAGKNKESRALALKCDQLRTQIDNCQQTKNDREKFEADLRNTRTSQPRQTPATAGDSVRQPSVKEPTSEELLDDLGYFMQAQFLSFKTHTPIRTILAGEAGFEQFRHDRLHAATTSNNGALVPVNYSNALIEALRAKTIVDSLVGVNQIPLENGNLTMPRQATTSTSYWTAETNNATPSDVTSDTITMSAKKLFTLVPVSGELLRRSSPSIAKMLRNDLIRVSARAIDLAFLRNATAGAPLGLKNLVDTYNSASQRVDATAQASLGATADLRAQAITRDLGKATLLLANGNVALESPYWIFAPRTEQYLMDLCDAQGRRVFPEMERGLLKGIPYKTTTQIPTNLTVTIGSSRPNCSEIYLVEATELLVGSTPTMELETSNTAAYFDGTNVVSAFSKDMVVSRLIQERDFNVRHLVSVAYIQGVDWGS